MTKRRLWIRRLSLILAGLVVLLIAFYFVITSSAFLKAVVLPRVGAMLGSEVTAASIRLSPFSELGVKDLQVRTSSPEPFLRIPEARVRYRLGELLGGAVKLQEIQLIAPSFVWIQNADGTSNLDPLFKALASKPEAQVPSKKAAPLELSLKNVRLSQATIRWIKTNKDGSRQTIVFDNINLTLDQLANRQAGKWTLNTAVRIEALAASTNANDPSSLSAAVDGSFDFSLDDSLRPQSLKGLLTLNATQASGVWREYQGLSASVDCDAAINLREAKAVIDRLDLGAMQGAAPLLQAGLDRPMTLIWGTNAGGIPDSSFQLSLTNLNLADWQALSDGRIQSGKVAMQMQVRSQEAGQKLGFNLSAQMADVGATWNSNHFEHVSLQLQTGGLLENFQRFQLNAFQLNLSRLNQRLVAFKGSASGDVKSKAFDAEVDFQAVLSEVLQLYPVPSLSASSGTVQFTGKLSQQNQAQRMTGKLTLADFTGGYAPQYRFQRFGAGLDADVEKKDNQLQIQRGVLTMGGGAAREAQVEFSGKWDLAKQAGQIAFKGQQLNAEALKPFVQSALAPRTLESVMLDASGLATFDAQADSTLRADIRVANLVIGDPDKRIPSTPLEAQATVAATMKGRTIVQVERLDLDARAGSQPAGKCQLSGEWNLSNTTGRVTFNITNLNQHLLGPSLNLLLAPQTLSSVTIHTAGSASYGANMSVKAGLTITNLIVRDPAVSQPLEALGCGLEVDGSLQDAVLDLRRVSLFLKPTPRANNQLHLQGKIDLGTNNASANQISLRAEALDLTPWYDLWSHRVTAPPRKPVRPADANTEPAAINLPLQRAVLDVKIGRLYLREIALSNWVATASINRGEVTLKPFQLTLNGAPVNGSGVLNLGLPGYGYDINLTASRVPLKPIVSFSQSDIPAEYQGNFDVQAQIKGAGITGVNLQKTLTGQVDLVLTNANVRLSPKSRLLLTPIALLLRLEELNNARVYGFRAHLQMGSGQVEVQPFELESDVFLAEIKGTIPIAEVLTNSPLRLPIGFSLERNLARKAGLLPVNTPTNVTFVTLPAFAKLGGTLGNPETYTDKLVITGLIARSAAGLPISVGRGAGKTLGKIGNIILGDSTTTEDTQAVPATTETSPPVAARTNIIETPVPAQPLSQPSAVRSLLPFGRRQTNAPATTSDSDTVKKLNVNPTRSLALTNRVPAKPSASTNQPRRSLK
jgi:hypothetical protein